MNNRQNDNNNESGFAVLFGAAIAVGFVLAAIAVVRMVAQYSIPGAIGLIVILIVAAVWGLSEL